MVTTEITKPERPNEIMKYFHPLHVAGAKIYCIPEDFYTILQADMSRYIMECESCPSWAATVR